MTKFPKLRPGIRVRLRSSSHVLKLQGDTGEVIRADDDDGLYIVRLDWPAKYVRADGSTEELPEIREYSDNMEVLSK